MAADGIPIDEATIARLLDLHGAYVDGRIREAEVSAESGPTQSEARRRSGDAVQIEKPGDRGLVDRYASAAISLARSDASTESTGAARGFDRLEWMIGQEEPGQQGRR